MLLPSVTNPYQGLLLGEPLAAPFAQAATGSWSNLASNALLSGTTNLSLQFTAADASRPVQQVDLFVDGTFARTLTNIPPQTNNVLYVTLNGYPTNYTVPANATIKSVVSNLTLRLNRTAYTNATQVQAIAHGDRIELRSLDFTKAGSQVPSWSAIQPAARRSSPPSSLPAAARLWTRLPMAFAAMPSRVTRQPAGITSCSASPRQRRGSDGRHNERRHQ